MFHVGHAGHLDAKVIDNKAKNDVTPHVTPQSRLLEECNPVVLVLILMLVLVGQLPPELAVVKINFTSFLTIYLSFTKL
jgi:hypothetical protein